MNKLVTYRDLKEQFGIPYTPQHILRLQKQGLFPLRRKLGNFNFWLWEDIDAWLRRLPVVQREASSKEG
jgi:prophage regulatory protein